MYITEIEIAIVIGVIISLIFSEKFGIVAGGMVVPAYLALYFDSIENILIVYLISFVTCFIVKFVLPKFMIIYGRRKFVACMVISVIMKILIEFLFPLFPFEVFEFRGISIIVPAILANTYTKQGVKVTVISSILVSLVVFIILNIIYII